MNQAPPMHSPVVRVFRVARGWRIFSTVVGGGFALMFASTPFWMFDSVVDSAGLVFLSVLFLSGAIFFALGAVAAHKERVEIYPDRVRKVGLFRTRELTSTNITGFRIVPGTVNAMLLVAKTPPLKQVKIDLVVERKAEFLQWVAENFPNLDAVDFETEVEAIRTDAQLGGSEEHRLFALRRARRIVGGFNGAVAVATIWGMILPRPYGWVMGALAVLPIGAFALLWAFPGVVELDGKTSGARPKLACAFIGPGAALALRAMLDWQILSWGNFWAPCLVTVTGLLLLLLKVAPELRHQRTAAVLYGVFFLVYAYGLVTHLNCFHDRSPSTAHSTTVTAARVSKGKSTTYYLTVQPWLEGTAPEETSVTRTVYERHPVGSTARIIVRRGALRIPWYYVR